MNLAMFSLKLKITFCAGAKKFNFKTRLPKLGWSNYLKNPKIWTN